MKKKESKRVKLRRDKDELKRFYPDRPPSNRSKKREHIKTTNKYAPSIEHILEEAGLSLFPRRKSKRRFARKPKKVDDFKEAFIPIRYGNPVITTEPIIVNRNRWSKNLMISGRRWRPFSLEQGCVARCERCGKVITSGYKSKDDYICYNCRERSYSHCNLWTVKKR